MTWHHENKRTPGPVGRPRASLGLTMIELLVVLAIIGLLAATAIPAFVKMGVLSKNELKQSSRELYAMLRAAKIYAATYRVNTAIVYENLDVDLTSYNQFNCLRAIMMMYKHPTQSYTDGQGNIRDVFVPTAESDSQFRLLPGGTGLRVGGPCTNAIGPQSPQEFEGNMGLREICARINDEDYPGLVGHVFMPNGMMSLTGSNEPSLNNTTGQELFRFSVCYDSAAESRERLYDITATGGNCATLLKNLRTIPIELQRSTGRARIVTE